MDPALAPVAAAAPAKAGPLTQAVVALLLAATVVAFVFIFQGWQQGRLSPHHPGKEAYVDAVLAGGLALSGVQTWRLLGAWRRWRVVLAGVILLGAGMKLLTAWVHLSEWLGG